VDVIIGDNRYKEHLNMVLGQAGIWKMERKCPYRGNRGIGRWV
jgi:hypothetical protein